MLAMKLRFYIYLVIFVALLVMLVLDPHLLARVSSAIAATVAPFVDKVRGTFAALT